MTSATDVLFLEKAQNHNLLEDCGGTEFSRKLGIAHGAAVVARRVPE